MRIKETVEKLVEQTTDILCNKCGCSCKIKHSRGFYGLIEAEVSGGYGSPVLEDMTRYTFSICELCLGEIFKTFKLPPQKEEYDLL